VKNFLKSDRHTHKDPQVRLNSLGSLDSSTPENQIIIERMATGDDDESVRLAAIDRLATVTALQRVLKAQPANTSVAGAVETRIIGLLSDNQVSESEANELLACEDSNYGPLIAINSANETIRLSSLSKLDNESVMVAVLEQTRFHDIRLACAEKLTIEENIRMALLACRSKDKAVAKLLQSQIDKKEAAIAKQKAEIQAVATTLNSMQALSESVWSPQFPGRYAALNAKWSALDAKVRASSQSKFAAADEAAKKIIAEHDKHDKKVAEENATESLSAKNAAGKSAKNQTAAQDISAQSDLTAGDATTDDAIVARESGSSEAIMPGCDGQSPADSHVRPRPTDIDTAAADQKSVKSVNTVKGTESGSASSVSNDVQTEVAVTKPDPQRDALLEKLKSKNLIELHKIEPDKINGAVPIESGSDSEKLLAHAQSVGVLFDPPFDIAKGRPGAITERIKRVKALLNTESILPGVHFDNCVYMDELKEHASALENRLEKAKQESVDRAKATHRQIGVLGSTIKDGKWGPASSMFRRLQKKVDSMEPAERSQFSDKMKRVEKQLAEMA